MRSGCLTVDTSIRFPHSHILRSLRIGIMRMEDNRDVSFGHLLVMSAILSRPSSKLETCLDAVKDSFADYQRDIKPYLNKPKNESKSTLDKYNDQFAWLRRFSELRKAKTEALKAEKAKKMAEEAELRRRERSVMADDRANTPANLPGPDYRKGNWS